MRFTNVIEDVLGNENKTKVIRTFVLFRKEYYLRELSRLTKIPASSLGRNIADLLNQKLLELRPAGNVNLLYLNEKHPLFRELEALFKKERELFGDIQAQIRNVLTIEPDVIVAAIFGSIAKREEKPDSDIDLFVVVKNNADIAKINDVLDKLGFELFKKYGNGLSPIIKKQSELTQLQNKPLFKEIKTGIVLVNKRGLKW